MIKDKSEMFEKGIELDLIGPDGNAFCLLANAKTYACQLGFDWKKIHNEMTDGDYEHLVDVFDNYFGAYVTLYR